MKMPRALNAAYEQSPSVQRNQNRFRAFREAFPAVDPAAYRGVARCPLSESPQPDPGWHAVTPPVTLAGVDEGARRRFLEMVGVDHRCDHYPCSLVATLAQAEELKL